MKGDFVVKKIFICILSAVILLNIEVVSAQTLNCNDILANGSKGSRVKILQTKLNKVMNCNLDVDGYVGPITESCIIKFQQKYNLDVDGAAGPQTCTKLNTLYTQEINKRYIVVTGNDVHIRKRPSLQIDDSILTTVNQGRILRTYGTKTIDGITWYIIHVKQNNETIKAYIHSNYAQKTAIILNITNQKLTYYYNGKILMESPVITGQKNLHETPVGKYIIDPATKSQNKTIAGYYVDGIITNSQVNYWIPFTTNEEIGFHDASWRTDTEYTKNTYLTNGSIGGIDMKQKDAKKLYKYINKKTYVIVTK